MNLKSECPHGRYDAHDYSHLGDDSLCPGGSLLPPDSLVIVKEDGEWALPFELGNSVTILGPEGAPVNVQEMFDALAAAQKGNSE